MQSETVKQSRNRTALMSTAQNLNNLELSSPATAKAPPAPTRAFRPRSPRPCRLTQPSHSRDPSLDPGVRHLRPAPEGAAGGGVDPASPANGSSGAEDEGEEDTGFADGSKARFSRELPGTPDRSGPGPTGDFNIVADQMATERADRVARFSSLITAMRLATVAISLLLAASTNQLLSTTRSLDSRDRGLRVFRAFRPVACLRRPPFAAEGDG
ncbi:MAG: hypothetical protein R2789_09535 [Microthrixaceae bacterium]